MKSLRIAPIVEGHGENAAIRILLSRTWELLGGESIDILRPIRHKRGQLAKQDKLSNAVQLAALKLAGAAVNPMPSLIFVLVDADEDLPCELAPKLSAWAKAARSDVDVSCVVANIQYETWFVAAAESLQKYLELPADVSIPENPEQQRRGKHWIERYFRGVKYSETQDQPSMTAAMDLSLCQKRSPSFDKLCRELASRLNRY
jgi:hypothetical protein